jgi:hypothetical protein
MDCRRADSSHQMSIQVMQIADKSDSSQLTGSIPCRKSATSAEGVNI